MTETALAVPDPRTMPVPFGWAEVNAEAVIESTDEWDGLDEAEGVLRAYVSWIEAHDGDATEFEKAMRMVEKRRADLWGDAPYPRVGTEHGPQSTFNRYQRIRDNWDWLRPIICAARKSSAVTQARVLKLIDEHTPAADDVASIASEADDAEAGDISILGGEFQKRLADLPDGSVDLILTDPPYPADLQHLWTDLAEMAASKLSPRGYLMAMSGKIHLDQVMARLDMHLTYGWMFSWTLEGAATRILGRNIRQTWKPILAYTTGTWARREPVPDTIPTGAAEKYADGWQQQVAPAAWIIEQFTAPTGLVVDPFLGAGSFGVAARDTGRRFIGVEQRADRLALATKRVLG